MKYIRTKDGRIIDLQKFIDEEKANPYYKNHRFNKIKQNGDLDYSAIGTDKNTITEQVGKRCYFQASLNSEIVSQANTIEELCDEFVCRTELDSVHKWFVDDLEYILKELDWLKEEQYNIYGAIWTDKGLIYVAKMNEDGVLCLL